MKKIISLTIMLLITTYSMFAQSQTKKYNSSLERYEYYDSRGQLMGYEKWNSTLQSWEYYENPYYKSNSEGTTYGAYKSPYNLELIERAMRYQQEQLDREREYASRQEMQAILAKVSKIQQLVDMYEKYGKPLSLSDGWYNVDAYSIKTTINNRNDIFCEKRKVYVQNNTVTKYIINDFVNRKIAFNSGELVAGTAQIRLENDNDIINIIFLDNLINSNSRASTPPQLCSISLWTNHKKAVSKTGIDFYVDGYYLGTIKKYCKKEEEPSTCSEGTQVWFKPGTYSYKAEGDDGITWSGTITFTSGKCSLFGLVKR